LLAVHVFGVFGVGAAFAEKIILLVWPLGW